MPKETITVGGTTQQPTTVHVGWDRTGHVQLATKGWLHGAAPDDPEVGLYADLNREQINTLIRHLRRARDTAYGRDE